MALLNKRNTIVALASTVILAASGIAYATRGGVPDLPMADVTSGTFTDIVEIRGEIRPFKSQIISAPPDAGTLTIVNIVRDGTRVKAGDVIVEFDPSGPQRQMMERMTEMKTAMAQVEQARAQAKITQEANATALMKADYDVQRAKLDLSGQEFLPKIDLEKYKLLLADAEQRFNETKRKVDADAKAAEASIGFAMRRVDRIKMEMERQEKALGRLQLKAPSDGIASIMPNFRTGQMGQAPQEFRTGDQAWPNVPLIELPDLSSVHLMTRVEEADRGRVLVSQRASIRIDALPGSDLQATITDISMLARPDFSSGWPPARNFEIKIAVDKADDRLRPGMSAVAKVAVGRIENATLVPAGAVFTVDGQPTVYKLDGRQFTAVKVEILRRNREQVAIKSGVAAGDKLALTDPTEPADGAAR